MIFLVVLTLLIPQIIAVKFEFTEYTHIATAFDGSKCLTGCSSENECVINWQWQVRNCRTYGVAPIYRTARIKDPLRKYCLSNCGRFGEPYEWCITTEDLKWDYCSSNDNATFLASQKPAAMTRFEKKCTNECVQETGDIEYFWCYSLTKEGKPIWEYCALPALPRVPVLANEFHVGDKKKGNCDGLLNYVTSNKVCSSSIDAADNYVTDIAEGIEATVMNDTNSLTQKFKVVNARSPIQSYVMVNVSKFLVPAVIRAHVTNKTIEDLSEISEDVERKVRDQMAGSGSSYETSRIIGSKLGGPNAEYNVVPRSLTEIDEWLNMEEAVMNWCERTGGSVDILVVIFYKDENTPIPNALGLSLVFNNADNSLFVGCREKIHWNHF